MLFASVYPDIPPGKCQRGILSFGCRLVVGSNSGNVLTRAQPISLDNRFPDCRGCDENLRSFNHSLTLPATTAPRVVGLGNVPMNNGEIWDSGADL